MGGGLLDPDGPFAAATFDTLGENHPHRIEPDDIAAVSLLDVSVPPTFVRAVTGHDRSIVAQMLEDIDVEKPLWLTDQTVLDNATKLWEWCRQFHGIDWVIAGKLLARKRHSLIPIYDSVVKSLLPAPGGGFWVTLRAALQDDDLRGRIDALRPPGLDSGVTTLRLLDVAAWMTGSRSENARSVRAS